MYHEFKLKTASHSIAAYHWPVTNPSHVVCLIHGIGEYALCYQRMAGYLNEAGIALVSMDLRGHGASAGTRGHCSPRKEVLMDIDRLLFQAQEFYPGVPLVLYGHSMGGNLVLDYRCRGNFNDTPAAYILSAPWILLARSVPPALERFVKVLSKARPELTFSAGVKSELLGNPMIIEEGRAKNKLSHNRISTRTGIEGLEVGKALLNGTCEDNGGAKGKPFLLMHGDADKICDVEGSRRLAEREKDTCTYVEWPSYYHEIHNGGEEADGSEVIRKSIQWIKATVPPMEA